MLTPDLVCHKQEKDHIFDISARLHGLHPNQMTSRGAFHPHPSYDSTIVFLARSHGKHSQYCTILHYKSLVQIPTPGLKTKEQMKL